MEYLKSSDIPYKGNIIIMGEKKNEKSDKKKKKILKKIMEVVSILGALSIMVAIAGYFLDIKNDINLLTEKLNEQSDKVNTMYDDIYIDENNINSQLTNLNNSVDNLQGQLDTIIEALNIKVIAVTDDSTISAIDDVNIQSFLGNYTLPVYLSNKPVGTDVYGELYYAEDLINEKVLLTYKENGKEVYFLGQYNEKYNWDGYCVTNSYYSDGTLQGICESNFQNGKREDYKSLYLSEENVWILSDRTCIDNVNSGTNTEYSFEYKNIKNFTSTNVRRTDILYIDNLLKNASDLVINQFYYGETSNQKYSDTSGKAYLVKYDADGTVKMLYMGNFINGYCEDKTGNAWNIAYSYELKDYFYNTGEFKNNGAVKKSITPITIEEIERIVSAYNFDCELKWKNDIS